MYVVPEDGKILIVLRRYMRTTGTKQLKYNKTL
jgi:hypothetical protein